MRNIALDNSGFVADLDADIADITFCDQHGGNVVRAVTFDEPVVASRPLQFTDSDLYLAAFFRAADEEQTPGFEPAYQR